MHPAVAAGHKDSATKIRAKHRARALQDVFEPLESRLLMAFSAHVNFQPSGASTPSGYVADVGAPYASRNALTYGWQYTNSHARERFVNSDQRYDTVAHMQYKGANSKWEIAVPNGTYKVHLVAGDPSYTNSLYKINAEGSLLLFGIPTSSKKYVEATANITVRDGRLTITNASGAVNNKVNYIDVTSLSSTTTSPTPTTTLKFAPATPTSLSAIGASTSQVRLNWRDASTRESGYYVERSTDGGKTYSRIATLGANSTTYLDGGRAAGRTYQYRVAAYNSYGKSSYTKASGTTKSNVLAMAPAPPIWFSASGASTTQVRLNWRDNSTRESGYYVERSTDNGQTYSRIGTLGANSKTFLDGGRTSGKMYYYRVAAHNSYGTSAWAKANGKPVSLAVAPAAPTSLTTSGASTMQIKLNWKDNSTRESGYYVQRSTDNGTTYTRIATLGAGSTSYLDGGRTSGKTYYYRVAAYNSYGTSGYVKATGRTQSSTGTGSTAPAAPTGLGVSGTSSTQIRLNWEDNSTREGGYYVERSDDGGKTYNKITTTGASTTTYLDSGRTTGKTYFYRVAAYNSAAKSSYTYATGTTTSASSPPPGTSGSYYDGVAIGMGGDVNKAIPILRALNIKAVRLWDGLSAWSNRWASDPVLQNAIKYHNAGFKVTLLTTTTKPPTYSQAKAYFDWVQKVPGLKGAVDFWEIGNEPDLTKYYQGTLEHYVANELRGAWNSLHPAGEKVIGGAPIFPHTAQRAKDAGYLNYVDYANVHPYNSTVSGLRNDMANFKAVFNSKPLVATEWNFHYVTDRTKWAQQVSEMHQYLDDYFVAAYYFGFEVNGTGSGAGGLVYDGSYSKNSLFYNAVDSWYASSSSTAAAPTTGSTTSSSDSTNPVDSLFSSSQIL